MTPAEILTAAFNNIVKQWNEDLLRKPGITNLERYNQNVALLNSLNNAGLFDPPLTKAAAGDYMVGEYDAAGFGYISVYITDTYAADYLGDWPIPYGV